MNGFVVVGGDGYFDVGFFEGVEGFDEFGFFDFEVGDGDKCVCSYGGFFFNCF